MITKYNTEIRNEDVIKNLKRFINQIYKLLPNREEGIDWKIPLSTLTEEIAGMAALFEDDLGSDSLSLLSKLEGLKEIPEDDFFSFRRTIFDCLNIMNRIRDNVKSR